jgi:hypothetical protein
MRYKYIITMCALLAHITYSLCSAGSKPRPNKITFSATSNKDFLHLSYYFRKLNGKSQAYLPIRFFLNTAYFTKEYAPSQGIVADSSTPPYVAAIVTNPATDQESGEAFLQLNIIADQRHNPLFQEVNRHEALSQKYRTLAWSTLFPGGMLFVTLSSGLTTGLITSKYALVGLSTCTGALLLVAFVAATLARYSKRRSIQSYNNLSTNDWRLITIPLTNSKGERDSDSNTTRVYSFIINNLDRSRLTKLIVQSMGEGAISNTESEPNLLKISCTARVSDYLELLKDGEIPQDEPPMITVTEENGEFFLP